MIVRERLVPPKALRFVLLLLAVTLATIHAQAAVPTAGQAKVERLVMGLTLRYRDYWRPWIVASSDHNIQHDPALEWLFEVDPDPGQYKPWLAESWKSRPSPVGMAVIWATLSF
jgi:ABC-type transport system substrate-binding protein